MKIASAGSIPAPCTHACFASDTRIGVGRTNDGFEFRKVSALKTSDSILTTNRTATGWEAGELTYVNQSEEGYQESVFYCAFEASSQEHLMLMVTGDHLFLGADGKLIPAARLYPGLGILQSDGGVAITQFLRAGRYSGRLYNVVVGDPQVKAGDLSGHLINAEGLVCADFALQMAYQQERLDKHLLSSIAGSSAQHLPATAGKAKKEFLNSRSKWPPSFIPDPEP